MVHIISTLLHWPNIYYFVIKAPVKEVVQKFTDVFNLTILNIIDRSIIYCIYCIRINLIKDLAKALNISYYTSKLNDQLDRYKYT